MDSSNNVYGGSSLVSLLHDSSNSLWVPSSSLTIHDTIVSHQGMDETNDDFDQPPAEKKRRLTPGQVEFLEKSFEVENKLEPERKMQLAKELRLEPRQVAIWFQNRRARFKIKQLEKGFECLKATYDQLMVDYQHLLKEKQGLQNEVEVLTNKIKQRNSSRVNSGSNTLVNNQLYSEPRDKIKPEVRSGKVSKIEASMDPSIKQVIEDASSTKSDVLDSDSPRAHGNHAPFLEDPNHTKILDPDEEKTGLMMDESLLFQTLPYNITSYNNNINSIDNVVKIEDNAIISCNFSLVEDQTFWSSLY